MKITLQTKIIIFFTDNDISNPMPLPLYTIKKINLKSIKISHRLQKIQNFNLGVIHFFNKTNITLKLDNPHEADHHATLEMRITSIKRNNSILKSTKEPLERLRSTI